MIWQALDILLRPWSVTSLLTGCILWATLAFSDSYTAQASAEPVTSKQQLEAAYLYNFLLFVHWPQENQSGGETTMTICIAGDDALGNHFAPVEGKAIKDTKYVLRIKKIPLPVREADLEGCAMLFLAGPPPGPLQEILAQIKGKPILTVSDQPDFEAAGGMLALVEQNGKLRWRINQDAANQVGLRFDGQLLRNAQAVINSGQEGQ